MAFCSVKRFFLNGTFRQPYTIFRYVRNVSRRGGKPKLLEGTVKNIEDPNDSEYSNIETYKDFVKRAKSALNTTDLEIEEVISGDGDFRPPISTSAIVDDTLREDKDYKCFVKKKIIGQKYVKMEKETNLLTYAAKVQIRYLHSLNPNEWTPEVLTQHFPITVSGVKKLLKSNFVMKSPERIKEHDEEVGKRWEILESGKPSELISLYTKCMWDRGKIIKQNYKGNPNFPTAEPDKNKITCKGDKKTGEYSAIVQQYINYKEEKESPQKLSSNEECQVIEGSTNNFNITNNKNKFNFFNRSRYYIDDETDGSLYNKRLTDVSKKSKFKDEVNVLHSQFKNNLMEEKHPDELTKWLQDQSKSPMPEISKNSPNLTELFLKIPKYKKELKELKRDVIEEEGDYTTFNNKPKYAYPKGKNIKSKIKLPTNLHKRSTSYKVDQCVYDENGEFLYKLPG